MLKKFRHNRFPLAKPSIYQQEMAILDAYHQRVMANPSLRDSLLVDSGIFVRKADGELAVAKPYEQIFTAKRRER